MRVFDADDEFSLFVSESAMAGGPAAFDSAFGSNYDDDMFHKSKMTFKASHSRSKSQSTAFNNVNQPKENDVSTLTTTATSSMEPEHVSNLYAGFAM